MTYSKNNVNNIIEFCHICFSELEEYCSPLYMCKKKDMQFAFSVVEMNIMEMFIVKKENFIMCVITNNGSH